MPEETTGSTVPRRQLGRYLRELRQKQRLTVRSAVDRLEWSGAKIWRIETGRSACQAVRPPYPCCRVPHAPWQTEAGRGGQPPSAGVAGLGATSSASNPSAFSR
jgi:hypothetical protein